MCLACEQGDLESRWEMIEIISHGRLPDGHTAEDLRAMGLPVIEVSAWTLYCLVRKPLPRRRLTKVRLTSSYSTC